MICRFSLHIRIKFWRSLESHSIAGKLLAILGFCDYSFLASLVAQTVKNMSTMWETPVQSLGWADPLEKEMATLSSILGP